MADQRASESEAEQTQRLAAGQLREANCRASESDHAQRLAANQQREANRRASESDAQRQHHLYGSRERIATYRANTSVGERQQQRENDSINAVRRRSSARQCTNRGLLLMNSERAFIMAQ